MERMSIPNGYKPNLAATLTKPELIKFPVYCSPKIDGIRCVVFDGVAYSRSLKPIPNEYVQRWFKVYADVLNGLDGELVVGSPTDPNCMQNSMAVMRKSGEPDFTFHVFDLYAPEFPYNGRNTLVETRIKAFYSKYPEIDIRMVPQHLCKSHEDINLLEARYLEEGYEGLMLRSPLGMYKHGRSTEREGGLVKVKRFTDAEAEVIGFVEEMANMNAPQTNALGQTERGTQACGLIGKGTLGALVVRYADDPDGTTFNIGTGFTAAQRADFWERRHEIVEQLVTFKYFNHGIKEAPRHPVFKSFRAKEDMS
jgi:DNA ligase-1